MDTVFGSIYRDFDLKDNQEALLAGLILCW